MLGWLGNCKWGNKQSSLSMATYRSPVKKVTSSSSSHRRKTSGRLTIVISHASLSLPQPRGYSHTPNTKYKANFKEATTAKGNSTQTAKGVHRQM